METRIEKCGWENDIDKVQINAAFDWVQNCMKIAPFYLSSEIEFDPKLPMIWNIATLGILLAHELGHGFHLDAYDPDWEGLDGNTMEEYAKRTLCISKTMDQFTAEVNCCFYQFSDIPFFS